MGGSMKSFHEHLAEAQTALRTKVQSGAKTQAQDRKLVVELYQAGYAVGLTAKEITQVLMKPLAPDLRQGLPKS